MKKIVLSFSLLLISFWLFSQAPEGFKYQAVARDATGNVLANKTVSLRISILSGTETGSVVYSEVHKDTTNTYGLVDFIIGGGINKTGIFGSINWGANKYFIKVEIDPAGGDTYTLMGVSQLMSVPYSLHAKTVEIDNVNDADPDPLNEIQSLNLNGNTLTLSKNGGSVTLPASTGGTGGDNWGTQYVNSDATLSGKGTVTEPLKIAQQSATIGKFLKWNGTTWAPGDEADGDATNEIQTISKTGNTVSLSRNGGSFTDAVDDADADATNEIQTLSLEGNNLILSLNGGTITLPTASGDNWGSQSVAVAPTIRGNGTETSPLDLASQNATEGQVLKFNGFYWAPARDETSSGGLSLPFSGISSPLDEVGFSISSNGSGINGISNLPGGIGVIGQNNSSVSNGIGVEGFSNSDEGVGVYGLATTTSGSATGVIGESRSSNGVGVLGRGISKGISGISTGEMGCGVQAMGDFGVSATGNTAVAGYGVITNSNSIGLYGIGNNAGIYGSTFSGGGYGGYFEGRTYVSDKLGIGVVDPVFRLDVAGTVNTNNGIPEGIALTCNGVEAIWSNGSYFSWGFGASSHNYFDKPITIGGFLTPDTYMLAVNGTAAKTDGASWSVLSDARMKNISGNYSKGLKEIVALQPVTFTYKEGNSRKLDSSKPQIGFVAQEVQKIFPEAVNLCSDGYLDFNMHAVNVALVNAVKELKAENDKLKSDGQLLKAENEELRKRNNQIDERLSKLEKLFNESAMK